jgi:hypothetical protein
MPLPAPKIHFDFIRKSNLPLLRDLLRLPTEQKLSIIHDPHGEKCGMEDMARHYGTTYTMTRLALMYEWERQQVVVVGPKMQAALGNTSLENVPIEMVRLPYPCFYLATPDSEDLVLWGGDRTGWHQVTGMYVAKEPTANSLIVLAWGEANEKSIDPMDDATFWFTLSLDNLFAAKSMEDVEFGPQTNDFNIEESFEASMQGERVGLTLDNVQRESDQAAESLKELHAKHPEALSNYDLDKALDRLLHTPSSESSDLGMGLTLKGQEAARVERVRKTARKLMRIAVNTVLYMNSTGADLSEPQTNDSERARLLRKIKGFKNPNKKDARLAKRRLDELSRSRVVWIGPSIEQAEVGGDFDFTEATGRHVSGHVRRGHWHTFLVGPRKKEGVAIPASKRGRTLKWVPPLWVGGTKEPAERRVYAVKE